MDYQDYYHMLGVTKTADDKEVKRVYQHLTRQYQRVYGGQPYGHNVNLHDLFSNGHVGRFSECFPQTFKNRYQDLWAKISRCVPTQRVGKQWHLYE